MQGVKESSSANKTTMEVNSSRTSLPDMNTLGSVPDFNKMYTTLYINRTWTESSLNELMRTFIRHARTAANNCYTQQLSIAKLKDCVSQALLSFLYIYRELPQMHNKPSYLSDMSDLLALYLDLELIASKKSKECHETIFARLVSCMYIYLENSVEHLLDTLLKMQFAYRCYWHILDPIVTKVVRDIPKHPESSSMYIRCFLIYRLWRKINIDKIVKDQINTAAVEILGPPPKTFSPSMLEDVLPKVPGPNSNSVVALLRQKMNIKRACELFVECCGSNFRNGCLLKDEDVSDKPTNFIKHLNKSNSESTHFAVVDKRDSVVKSTSDSALKSSTSQVITLSKYSHAKKKTRRCNKIILIDLTNDVTFEKTIIKRKTSKTLLWLQDARTQVDTKRVKTSNNRIDQKKSCHTNLLSTVLKSNHHLEEGGGCRGINDTSNSMEDNDVRKLLSTGASAQPVSADEANNKCSNAQELCVASTVDLPVQTHSATSTLVTDNRFPVALKDFDESNIARREVESSCLSTDLNINFSLKVPSVIRQVSAPHTTLALAEAKICKELIVQRPERSCGSPNSRTNTLINNPDNFECPSVLDSNDVLYTVSKNMIQGETGLSSDNMDKLQQSVFKYNTTADNATRVTKSCSIHKKQAMAQKFSDSDAGKNHLVDRDHENNMTCLVVKCTDSLKDNSPYGSQGSKGITACYKLRHEIDRQKNYDDRVPVDSKRFNYDNDTREDLVQASHGVDNPEFCLDSSSTTKNTNKRSISETCKILSNLEEDRITPSLSSLTDSKKTDNGLEYPYQVHTNIDDTRFSHGQQGHDSDSRKPINSVKMGYNDAKETITLSDKQFGVSLPPHFDDAKRSWRKRQIDGTSGLEAADSVKNVLENVALCDDIDGLSLLASVSQQVPHLKPDTGMRADHIKVKDYATLRKTASTLIPEHRIGFNRSLTNLPVSPKPVLPEISNKASQIYPECILQNVAFEVEVPSNNSADINHGSEYVSRDSTYSTSANIGTDETNGAFHNVTPVKNNIQSIKEQTNVILNGETIVLLQKSPNSNLYVINKAIEKTKRKSGAEISKPKENIINGWSGAQDDSSGSEVTYSPEHSSHALLDILQHTTNKVFACPDDKSTLRCTKVVKVEPEERSPPDVLDVQNYPQPLCSEANAVNITPSKALERYHNAPPNPVYGKIIKHEYNGMSGYIAANCSLQGCSGMHSYVPDVESPHPLHISTNHSGTLSSRCVNYTNCSNCTSSSDLCVPFHNQCASVSCNLQLGAGTSLHAHGTTVNNGCGSPRCTFLNCSYDIVTHCRQCLSLHSVSDPHVSCIKSNPYFLSTHSALKSTAIPDCDRSGNNPGLSTLQENQLLCKISENLLGYSDQYETQRTSELYPTIIDNKLPLKKRLRGQHAMMSMVYDEIQIKTEQPDGYSPSSVPPVNSFQIQTELQIKSNQSDANSVGNVLSPRKKERTLVHTELCSDIPAKPHMKRQQASISCDASLSRLVRDNISQKHSCKKVKKSELPLRQIRSSKRNVPKVNYSYSDVDSEWNPSIESKRRRKKIGR